jgi:aldehyde:ferredoxin oxidoreductase
VTGNEASLEQLLELSNDIFDLTRLINTRLGMSRINDALPHKVWANPPLTGPNAGKVIDRGYFQNLLSQYYEKRGWDKNGIPQNTAENNFKD